MSHAKRDGAADAPGSERNVKPDKNHVLKQSMKVNPRHVGILLAGLVAVAVPARAQTQTNVFTPVADTFVRYGINQENNYGSLEYLELYGNGTARDYFSYVRFDLSSLPAGIQLTDASLHLTKVTGGIRNDTLTTGRLRILGLNEVDGNTPQNWDELSLTFNTIGAEWTNPNEFDPTRVTSFDNDLGNEVADNTAGFATISGANLVSFLSDRLNSGGLVTFILDFATTEGGRGFAFGSRENTNPDARPQLTVAWVVPEPTLPALLTLGGLLFLAWHRRLR